MDAALLNTRELAIQLEVEVTPDFLTDLARSQKIPAEKVGSRWTFKKKDVPRIRNFLKNHQKAL